MKRITEIGITNCRAYSKSYTINIPNGQNLLIYGENGSGKSSLYRAINDYLKSSRDSLLSFHKNRCHLDHDGKIRICFSDFDENNERIITPAREFYFGSNSSNHHISFIQDACLIKGFLDYTDLLKVYFHNDSRPNLFELIVLNLLGNHIPIKTGGNFKFKEKWISLQKSLIDKSYTRRDKIHQFALRELKAFETHLRSTLDEIFNELNILIHTYFDDLQLELGYDLRPLTFNYGPKWQWHTTTDLRLKISNDGLILDDDYNFILNEARLSAVSICLYLASLLQMPRDLDFKILYLDDVFIGLDTGNRIPILKILNDKFFDYQIFISTYDRHLFEFAQRYFFHNGKTSWLSLEMYVGKSLKETNAIMSPIIISGESYYNKALHHLHHRSLPDYPAAANYFRKAFEELINNFIPPYEKTDDEASQIPAYKLTLMTSILHRFLDKTFNDTAEVSKLQSLLHTLLHPLSHHELTSPLYRAELQSLETIYSSLKMQFEKICRSQDFKCIKERGSRFRIKINFSKDEYSYYLIVLEESLLKIIIEPNVQNLSASKCRVIKCEIVKSNSASKKFYPSKDNRNFHYNSLSDAVNKIYEYLIGVEKKSLVKPTDYKNVLEVLDLSNGSYIPFVI